jgi:two-component system sensor histidine kinase HydH
MAQISITDTGRGIPAGLETKIFEPDFTTKAGGTGLGLAIVRQTIHHHGGTINARRRDAAGGAEFTILLPSAV